MGNRKTAAQGLLVLGLVLSGATWITLLIVGAQLASAHIGGGGDVLHLLQVTRLEAGSVVSVADLTLSPLGHLVVALPFLICCAVAAGLPVTREPAQQTA